MKCRNYDLKIIAAIKAIRLLRGEKQANLAAVLHIDQSEYCRIERGERTISVGQLHLLARYLRSSLFQIVAIAEAEYIDDFSVTPLSRILIDFVNSAEQLSKDQNYSPSELDFILERVRGTLVKE